MSRARTNPTARYSNAQNAQARFIVERLRKALSTLSGNNRSKSREEISGLERALAAYDTIVSEGL